jgi:hypothetical protein
MLPFVDAIVTLFHCIYLMQSLYHNLLDICKYLMMQSSLWKILARTRACEGAVLDILEESAGRGFDQPPSGNAAPRAPVSL